MKSSVVAHPEAMLHSIADAFSALEAELNRYKILVMSTGA